MNLLEIEGKRLFIDYGIPVPEGVLSRGGAVSLPFGFPAVVKAQAPTGGRGRAGGVRIVRDKAELESAVREIIGMNIGGHAVTDVLIERKVESRKELYVSIAVDRSKRKPLIIASEVGGMDIESAPEDRIIRDWIDPWVGIQPFMLRRFILGLGLGKESSGQFRAIIQGVWRLFQDMDAELVEINPLIMTDGGRLIAADSKVVIDDDSLFRHEELRRSTAREMTDLESIARDEEIAFVQLEGDIGVIANGAGLTMATLDLLTSSGGKGGAFLDLGGTDDPEKVKCAVLLMAKAKPKVVLLNIFGGITKCDTVASGLLQAYNEGDLDFPIVARIKGVNEDEAVAMLKGSKMKAALSLKEAVEAAVEIASGG